MKYILTILLVFSVAVNAEVNIKASGSAPGGSKLTVSVSGQVSRSDMLSILLPDDPEGRINKRFYIKDRSSVEVDLPIRAGNYELRYIAAKNRETLASMPITVTEVTAELKAPDQIKAGARVKIYWEAPGYKSDFITIVEKDAEEGRYKHYQYVKRGNPIWLNAPERAGEYEIRYASGPRYSTIGSKTLLVTAVSASLKAPESVKAGQKFYVEFEGPRNEKDFITIVQKDAEERKYGKYQYVKRAKLDNKLKFTAPDDAGEYELRYLSGHEYRTVGSTVIRVDSTTASVSAPTEIVAGSEFKVKWEGPNNERDFITIVPKGEEERKYGPYVYVKRSDENNIVKLTALEDEGEYEVRYLSGQKYRTLASQTVRIVPTSASINSPDQAEAGTRIKVTWEGPGNKSDYITLAEKGSENRKYVNYAYVRRGPELRLEVPERAGTYEVRYVTGGKHTVLATNILQVTPSRIPGKLQVVSHGEESVSVKSTAVGVILDASGSMLKRESGKRRIDIAKTALNNLVDQGLDQSASVALRVFGHKEADSCRTDLEVPLAPLNRSRLKSTISNIEAKNLAKTPIAKSLELAKADLAAATGKRILVLVTDGEETCDGDPRQAIRELMQSGVDTRVNIVGFAIEELMLKDTFREWARIGNGTYFDARNAEELERSVIEAIQVPYEVLNTEGEVLGEGVVNGDPIKVLPGTYNVRVLSSPSNLVELVEVEPKKTRIVDIGNSKSLG